MTPAKGDPGRDGPFCGGLTKAGGTCRLPAGHGTPHPGVGRCDRHAGCTPSHVKAGARTLAERELAELRSLGHPVPASEVDPGQALLAMVGEAVGNVDALRRIVADLPVTGEGREAALEELYRAWCGLQADFATRALRAGVEERQEQRLGVLAELLGRFVRDLLSAPELALPFEAQQVGFEVAGRLMRALPDPA